MATKRFIAKNGLDNNSLTITNVADPTNAQDASTKAYTDLKASTSQTMFIGTTSVAINRTSANLALTGISSVTLPGSTSGTVQLIPTAAVGTGTILTIPAVTGTIVTTGDTGSVTNTMLAGSIAITKLASSTISGVSLGSNLNALTISSPLVGTSYNGSAAVTLSIPAATTSVSGYLTSTDWNTFNGKQAAGSYLTASTGVTTFNGGTTGLTPASATSGAITLAGTLAVANGGTGLTTSNPKLIGSFTIASADTNWWRVASMDANNQPRYAKFLIVTTNHLNIEITFSNGAGGDNGHVEVIVRGHYSYWTTYPSFIRYNPTGVNAPSYVEIQLPLTGGTGNTFTVYELENFSLGNAWVTYPMATTGVATAAGTSLQFFSNTAILRRDGYIGNGYTKEMYLAAATASVNGYMTSTYASKLDGIATGATANTGTVTSVGFTGGLLTVGTATTTPAITVAGTSGGIPYFSSASTWATSAALAASSLVIGGGAGVAPSTTTTGTGVVTALGVAVGTAGSFVTNGGALGTPSSGTVTNLTGTASININGTVGATTANTGAFTNLSYTGTLTGSTGILNIGSGQLYKDASGNVGIGISSGLTYKLQVVGSFAATTKSFVIDHPTKEGMKLRYGSLEGPENGIYIRGRLNGNNIIQLPEYWTKLIDEDSITVNLTPIGKHQKLYVADIIDNTVIIGNDNLLNKEINCFYTVFAERIDVEKLIVEVQ